MAGQRRLPVGTRTLRNRALFHMAKSKRRAPPLGAGQTPCRHCGETKAVRPRQLCWACYYNPKIRAKYGPVSHMARLGGLRDHRYSGRRRKSPEPTAAVPGTDEKILVLQQRLERGEDLYHRGDKKLDLT